MSSTRDASPSVIDRDGLQRLLDALKRSGFAVVGPRVRDGAIVYAPLARVDELPQGWTDLQDGGSYTLVRRTDAALFGYAVGPNSWKQFLHPARELLWEVRRDPSGVLAFEAPPPDTSRYAFIGVRACELQAIAVQDRVFMGGPFEDAAYACRRHHAFIVAINCGSPAGTCFCASMQSGPQARAGFDLALTEVLDGARHRFVVTVGSDAGAAVLTQIEAQPADAADREAEGMVLARSAGAMGRTLRTDGLRELLQAKLEHPRWAEVGERCLQCGNCTMVCPTCFCHTVEDQSDLLGEHAQRVRLWDSCFTLDFSYVHGGSVRHGGAARYRQWMTHKLANWIDQFGTSGCVGCGRCITWCPVGIDITAEAAAMQDGGASRGQGDA